MTELTKTGIFAGVAAIALGLAWAWRPTAVISESELADEKRGSAIFPNFEPSAATSFSISRFDENLATLSRIELAKDNKTDLWTLPSADGYPADSAEQVSRAITPLVDLTVLSTVSTDRGDHAEFGVVEPDEQQLTVGASGVGLLVHVGGADNKVLADLIIGKKVENTENQHYVRVPSEDAIYIAEIEADVFSTDLARWIKGEVLNVRSFDIEHVGLRDYAILPTERGYGLGRNFDADLAFNDNKWSLVNFVDYTQEGAPSTNQIPEGKVLGENALNDLKNSVQNLKIMSVRHKPLGLAADLKVDKSLEDNQESIKSLQNQGFFPQSGELYAAGGELIVGTKDGVQYLLRFGNTKVNASALKPDEKKDGEEAATDEGDEGVSRYLLVTAKLDESKFPPPDLKIVPETVEEMLAQEAAANAENAPAENNPVEIPAEDQITPEQLAAPEVTSDAAPGESAPASGPESATPEVEPSATESEEVQLEGSSGNEGDAGAPANGNRSVQMPPTTLRAGKLVAAVTPQEGDQEGSPTENAPAPAAQETSQDGATVPPSGTELAPSGQESPEELQERLEFLQETIRKENQRLLDARNEKLNEARRKVAELNARFADWYYVVSDTVYAKLRVSRDKLFPSAQAAGNVPGQPAGGFGLPALPGGSIQLPTTE